MSDPIDSGWWQAPSSDDIPDVVEHRLDARIAEDPEAVVGAGRTQHLALWEQELRDKEHQLSEWASWLHEQSEIIPAWTLPARPVTDALRTLYRHGYLGDGDIATFAHGFGLDTTDTQQLLRGQVDELDIGQIAQLCEALKCSPYDLWQPDVARTILHAYGPERWPRYIEPLDAGRALEQDDTFLQRRVKQQANEIVTVHHDDRQEVRHGQPAVVTEVFVTCYRETGVLQVDDDGMISPVRDAALPAVDGAEYHLTFQQIGPPQRLKLSLDEAQFSAGPSAGHDADPSLAEAANRIRPQPELHGTTMVRFTNTISSSEQWLGWDTGSATWQTWDDPRDYFPGDPSQVLAGPELGEPLPLHLSSTEEGDRFLATPMSGIEF